MSRREQLRDIGYLLAWVAFVCASASVVALTIGVFK